MSQTFEQVYPHITRWVTTHGWVEIGADEYLRSMVRALDEGGMVWEGLEDYPSLDDALNAMEEGLAEHIRERWGE